MNLKKDFLSGANVVHVSQLVQMPPQLIQPIMSAYTRPDVLQKAQGCLPVLNHMFVQTLSEQDYDALGQNICNKVDQNDINYQTMMPNEPYMITNRDKNMVPWQQMTSARQPQKIGKYQGTFLRINPQGFTDLKQSETENPVYKNFSSSYYATNKHNPVKQFASEYNDLVFQQPETTDFAYTYIDSKTLY